MIGIIDYGMGNLRSVQNALQSLGFPTSVITDPAAAADCGHLILPGVGAFANAADNLRRLGFDTALRNHVAEGKPLLGICLGMQLFASRGQEPYPSEGLGLIPGEVIPLELPAPFKIPHVGWNNLQHRRSHPVFEGIKKTIDFYFVHSYHFVTENPEDQLTLSNCAAEFVSTVAKGSIVGVQFHPEKSQDNGLKLLENFCVWDGRLEDDSAV